MDLNRTDSSLHPPPVQPAILEFREVSKRYDSPGGARLVLNQVSFSLAAGRKVAIIGPSGSGKSTLLNLAAGVDTPSSGAIWIEGCEIDRLSDHRRTLLRREKIGLLFQFFHLLSHLTVMENVILPDLIAGRSSSQAVPRAKELLNKVGLLERRDDNILQLSGGEMQRVALCRALLRRPRLLLADEPTGNLDELNSTAVIELLLEMASDTQGALLFATHSRRLASQADEIWELHQGRLESSR